MQGKTHIALGMASALIVTHPVTAPEVIIAMTGGAIGGRIVDVDRNDIKIDPDSKNKGDVYDAIISFLFISVLVVLDFFLGNGISRFIIDNWGVKIWGGLLGIFILMLVAHFTPHRTFSHSFLGMGLFYVAVRLFCQPIALSFLVGFASHLVVDLFNIRGIQLFYPLKWTPSFKLFKSNNQKANKYMFWIFMIFNILMGGFLFVRDIINNGWRYDFIRGISKPKLFGLNAFQVYLIFINLFTFIGFQRSARKADREQLMDTNKDIRIALEFETWFLNFMVFIGGGLGMFLSLVRNKAYPAAYNGVWWSFCYASILSWFTIYCYICNPFNWITSDIPRFSLEHISYLIYFLAINIISALLFFIFRNRRPSEYSLIHTLLLLVGALGGTIGAILVLIASRKTGKSKTYNYAILGFPIMLIGQIVFGLYMLSVDIL